MAKEVLLEREMAFYDKADAQIAELVPLIQDLRDGLVNPPFTDAKANYLTRVLELVVEMKNLSLRYEAYVEPGICGAFKELVIELQSQGGRWHDLAKIISAEADTTDGQKADAGRMCDTVLFLVALVRMRQANYLKLLSGEKVIGIEDPDQGTP